MQRDARCHTARHNLSQRGRERIPKSDCGFYKAKWKEANESEHMGMDQVFTVLSFSLFLALSRSNTAIKDETWKRSGQRGKEEQRASLNSKCNLDSRRGNGVLYALLLRTRPCDNFSRCNVIFFQFPSFMASH